MYLEPYVTHSNLLVYHLVKIQVRFLLLLFQQLFHLLFFIIFTFLIFFLVIFRIILIVKWLILLPTYCSFYSMYICHSNLRLVLLGTGLVRLGSLHVVTFFGIWKKSKLLVTHLLLPTCCPNAVQET